MEIVLVLLLSVLAVAGAVAGVGLATAGRSSPGRSSPGRPSRGDEPGLLRVAAAVPTGWEQTLLGLHRELGLPRSAAELPYGALYLEPLHEQQLLVRSRSEIGRGFLGIVDIVPGRGRTDVTYRILRLPGDDRVRERVLNLELQLITALRRVHGGVEVQLIGGPLRDGDLQDVHAVELEDRG